MERGRQFAKAKGNILFIKGVAEYLGIGDIPTVPSLDHQDIPIVPCVDPRVETALELLIGDEKDVILIPIPQYPLYSASVMRLGGTSVSYELREDYGDSNACWRVEVAKIDQIVQKCHAQGQRVRSIFVINPGNPTGACKEFYETLKDFQRSLKGARKEPYRSFKRASQKT